MKKFISAFLISLLSIGAVNAAPPVQSSFNLILETPEGHGSGIYLGNGKVLTAAHVASELDKTVGDVRDDQGNKYTYQVLWTSERFDVAEIQINEPKNIETQTLDCAPNPIGEKVKIYGNPLNVEFSYTTGEIIGKPTMQKPWNTVVPVDGTIIPGQSGGAVVDEATGKTVGVAVGVANFEMGITGLGFIVPASVVCNIMSK